MPDHASDNFQGKRLFLVRHALALNSNDEGDKARRLSPKGQEDACALGSMMKKGGYVPDLILCSSAMRTRETLEHMQESYAHECKTAFHDILYSGTTGDYLHLIQQTDPDIQHLMIVAHNPSIYELVVLLSGMGQDSMLQRLSEGYHPATLSVIECSCNTWSAIQPADNRLVFFTDPMDYNAPSRPTRWM